MPEPVKDVQMWESMRKATEVAIRLFLVAALSWWCFLIFRPFLMLVVWGIVIAVALSPIFYRLESLLGGRRKLAGTLLILLGIGALLVPTLLVSESFFESMKWLQVQQAQESLRIPPPSSNVADWPLIGDQVHDLWTQGSENLEATLRRFGPQVKSFGSWLLATLTGFGVAFLLTIVSIVIAGVMLIHSEGGGRTARAIGARLGGEQGEAVVVLATQTIRSVAYGVVGVAAVQAALAAVGLFLAESLIILGPVILYVVATSDNTLTQVLFTIWSMIVSFADLVLKPLFLGRGLTIPMPVILIGAIGGLVRAGIIGLFVGAVVLAIGYNIFKVWMNQEEV